MLIKLKYAVQENSHVVKSYTKRLEVVCLVSVADDDSRHCAEQAEGNISSVEEEGVVANRPIFGNENPGRIVEIVDTILQRKQSVSSNSKLRVLETLPRKSKVHQ